MRYVEAFENARIALVVISAYFYYGIKSIVMNG